MVLRSRFVCTVSGTHTGSSLVQKIWQTGPHPKPCGLIPTLHFGAYVSVATGLATNRSIHIATYDVLDTIGDFIIHSYDAADMSELAIPGMG